MPRYLADGTPQLPAGAIPAAAIIAVATIAVTIVPVKTKAAGDAGTGRVADHPASDEAGRAEQKGARSSPALAAVGANAKRAPTMNAIAITRLMIPSRDVGRYFARSPVRPSY